MKTHRAAFLLLALCSFSAISCFFSSCSTLREITKEEEPTIKSEVFRKAYKLLQEKCAFHGIQNDVVFELDSSSFRRAFDETYDNSWLRGVLDIPRKFNTFEVFFTISVRNKPYLHTYSVVSLNDYSGKIAGKSISAIRGRYGQLYGQAQSELELIKIGKDIENCKRPWRLMSVDTAIARARSILGISDTIPCVSAYSAPTSNDESIYCGICAKRSKELWKLNFLLEPPDTTYFYVRRLQGAKPSDILTEIPTRNRHEGWDKHDLSQALLQCTVDMESGELCEVYVTEEIGDYMRGFVGFRVLQLSNPNLEPFLDRVDSICKSKYRYYLRQKWSK